MGLSIAGPTTGTAPKYGPTPLHLYQGEQGFYIFNVVADPGVVYSSLTAGVRIFDGNGNLVRTLQKAVTLGTDHKVLVHLTWDGKNDSGSLVPPGTYAPTFFATGVR